MSDMNLRAQVEVVLKDHGLLEVNQRLKTTEDRLKSTSTATTTAGAGFGALATRLAGAAAAFISIGSALRFVDSSVTQFAKLDRQLRALAIQMDAMGISSKDALPEVRKFLEAIEASGGATLDQTVPAFQKYLGLTKSVEQATALVSLAFRAAEGSGNDFATTADQLVQLMQGRALGAASQLGVAFKRTGDDIADAQRALEDAFKRWPEKVADIDDMQNALDRGTAAWARLSRAVAIDFGPAITGMKEYSAKVVETGYLLATGWMGVGGAQMKERLRAIWTDATEAVKNFEAEVANVDPVMAKFLEEQNKINALKATIASNRPDKSAEDAAKERERIADAEFELARIRAQDMADINKSIDDARTKSIEDYAKKNLDIMQRDIEEYAKSQDEKKRLSGELLSAVLANTKEGSAQWVAMETTQLDAWRDAEVAKAGRDKERLLLIERIYQQRLLALRKRESDADIALAKMTAEQKIEASQAILGATSQLIGAVFQDSKAAAIAQAVISAAQSILGIWEHWAWNPPVAGALTALAAGVAAAQIASIRSANPGGGSFSAAGAGGGVSAGNMAGGVSKIALTGPNTASAHEIVTAGAPDTGSVRSASAAGGITINYHGTVIDSERAERKLSRRLKIAERRDQVRQVR